MIGTATDNIKKHAIVQALEAISGNLNADVFMVYHSLLALMERVFYQVLFSQILNDLPLFYVSVITMQNLKFFIGKTSRFFDK